MPPVLLLFLFVDRPSDLTLPLNDKSQTLSEQDKPTAQFQYFLKLVPTVYRDMLGRQQNTHQFSATMHKQVVDLSSGIIVQPGVFFKYDFAPMMISMEKEEGISYNLFRNICGIAGGVFSILGLIDSFLYRTTTALKEA